MESCTEKMQQANNLQIFDVFSINVKNNSQEVSNIQWHAVSIVKFNEYFRVISPSCDT